MRYVATIGSFDGVHRGHQCLLQQVRSLADERGLKAMAITFAVSPKQVLGSNDVVLLNSVEERLTLLRKVGMDEVPMLEFTHEMAAMSARDFMSQVLKKQLGVEVLVIGYDHRFGRGRTDGFNDYVRYGRELGIEVVRGEACVEQGEAVSSTRIRSCISEGRVFEASHLLGYYYRLCGTVVGGYKVGRKMGFPTANIHVKESEKLLPSDGVYAVFVYVDADSECKHVGMLNIGYRPTVNNGSERSIEVHILDFEGDLYGKALCVEFVERLRDERTFDTLDALMVQLEADKERVIKLKDL